MVWLDRTSGKPTNKRDLNSTVNVPQSNVTGYQKLAAVRKKLATVKIGGPEYKELEKQLAALKQYDPNMQAIAPQVKAIEQKIKNKQPLTAAEKEFYYG